MNQNQEIHDELQDRLMDLALRRRLGTERAPDLSEKIGSVESLRPTSLMGRTWFRLVIAASVMLTIGFAIRAINGNWAESVVVIDDSYSTGRNRTASERSPTLTVDGVVSAHDQPYLRDGRFDENNTVILEGTTVQLPPGTRLDEITRLETQAKSIRELIKQEKSDQGSGQAPNHGISISAGPAGGISVDANGVVTFEKMPTTRPRSFATRGESQRNELYGVEEDEEGMASDVLAGVDDGRSADLAKSPAIQRPVPGFMQREDVDVAVAGQSERREGGRQNAKAPSPYWSNDDVGYDARRKEFRDTLDAQGRDRFARLTDNRFLTATDNPLSTFSIDVDTASYSVVRSRIEQQRVLPPPAAVRVEELVNYFSYDYPQPTDGAPFAVHVDVAACPWATKHRLVRIGLKGKEIPKSERPASNLVFLVDVSGSMQPANKLPLVRSGLMRLVGELDERDRVAIVVYAGSSGCVLASTPCTQANKERVRSAIAALESGGSTNGAAGIELAYQIAQDHFVKGGANRVILCTDGDFNVGTTSDEALKQLVADRAKSGVFLTALGFGMGNHNDQMLEAIADNGNGTYGYIDDEREVEKLFVRQLSGTLVTIAKDVKIQVEFNPAQVGAYRLIGYENRILAKEDFNNDKKDAGDIGAGHTVTALYEIVPPAALAEASKANAAANEGVNNAGGAGTGERGSVDALEFQRPKQELELTDAAKTSGDLLLVKLRYKAPDGDTSTLIKTPAKDAGTTFAAAGRDFKFAAAAAAFGMILRQSPFRGDITLAAVEEIAQANVGEDQDGQRKAFVDLVRQLRGMTEGRGARD